MTRIYSVDLETSSTAPLQSVGSYAYLSHPSTIVLMAVFHLVGSSEPAILWRRGDPIPPLLIEHIVNNGVFAGWNVMFFDRIGYRLLMQPLGWPSIADENWRDTMHLAAAANLPRSLDACAKAVGVEFITDLKDNNRVRRVTDQNRTPIPADVGRILDNPMCFDEKLVDDLRWLADRCVQDVVLEEAVMVRLPPWPDMYPWLAMPHIDRRINDRGILIDVTLVRGLEKAARDETTRLDHQMMNLTGGEVPRCSTVERLKHWLLARGVPVPRKEEKISDSDDDFEEDDETEPKEEKQSPYRLRKNDIANLLAGELSDECREALYMRAEAAKASTKKLRAMQRSEINGRLYNTLILMGAQAVGRFSSSGGVQVHNLVRDAFGKDYENIAIQNGVNPKDKTAVRAAAAQALKTAIEIGRTGDADLMRAMYQGDRKDLQGRSRVEGVLPWISRMMRRTIGAPAGQVLLNGDFSNIQARLPVWLAGQQETVDQFARGEDLYRIQASPIYGVPPDQLTAEQRQIGKISRLFLGFAASANAFIPAAMNYGISIPRADAVRYVDIFRATNEPLVRFWDANLQAAMWAVMYPGHEFAVPPLNIVTWFVYRECLCMRLPSGRLLRYWQPRLEQGYWQDGSPKKQLDLTVLFVKGKFMFRRALWRGLAVQNLIAASESDLLCCALNNMEKAGLPVMIHVHDSIAVTIDEDKAEAALPVFKQCMLAMPDWTRGLPIAADCDISTRFG